MTFQFHKLDSPKKLKFFSRIGQPCCSVFKIFEIHCNALQTAAHVTRLISRVSNASDRWQSVGERGWEEQGEALTNTWVCRSKSASGTGFQATNRCVRGLKLFRKYKIIVGFLFTFPSSFMVDLSHSTKCHEKCSLVIRERIKLRVTSMKANFKWNLRECVGA